MTFNVEDCDGGYAGTEVQSVLDSRALEIVDIIKDKNIDVVVFQEIQPGSGTHDKYGDDSRSSNGDVSTMNRAFIKRDYIMPYYAFNSAGSIRRDFIAVWSKIRPTGIVSVFPTDGGFDPSTGNKYRPSRPILRFRVQHGSHDIWFYGCHLKSNSGGVIEQNAGNRRAQAFHLARYIMRNQNPEKDLIVILGDMNTMEEDYDAKSGNATMDFLCLRYDNPFNLANDFIPVNLNEIGAVTNSPVPLWGAGTLGTTHPGSDNGTGYSDATFDHILVSPTIYNGGYYAPGSINIIRKSRRFGGGPADHFPVMLTLTNL
ncbi:MAG: endonuclease/exonuclease/phosphatase family protein [Spirochaetota bacterium]|nr:endonuclease/exonuclease/phosphatase family protein [Spirochaetota bacterium]